MEVGVGEVKKVGLTEVLYVEGELSIPAGREGFYSLQGEQLDLERGVDCGMSLLPECINTLNVQGLCRINYDSKI